MRKANYIIKTKRWEQKIKDHKQRAIRFTNRTYEALILAILALKDRYRRSVTFKMKAQGAGLYCGIIIVS